MPFLQAVEQDRGNLRDQPLRDVDGQARPLDHEDLDHLVVGEPVHHLVEGRIGEFRSVVGQQRFYHVLLAGLGNGIGDLRGDAFPFGDRELFGDASLAHDLDEV